MVNKTAYDHSFEFAKTLDDSDELAGFRDQFYLPKDKQGNELIYFCGNSLGLQPRQTPSYIRQELDDWSTLGVEGHFHAKHPWMPYHEILTKSMAKIVGAREHEVVIMNSLTVNLHLMMVSFYRPTAERRKILIEHMTFPSDRYAVDSQIRFHGFDPKENVIELKPDPGTEYVSLQQMTEVLEDEGESIALVLIGNVNYYSGQGYPIKEITNLAHRNGCKIGFNLAHGAGNLMLDLHNDGPDFAVWCTYKYLNSGPGGLAGCFVHDRHANTDGLPRFAGWWGHDKKRRFLMEPSFIPIPGAEGWQLSNPPIFQMASIKSSLDLFELAGMEKLTQKSKALTGYLEFLLIDKDQETFQIITPSDPDERGCQLSIQIKNADKTLFHEISSNGIVADWREPDVIRVAPVPLYNSFVEVWNFAHIIQKVCK